ncbi:MAG: hypothetical protein HZB56_05290 [Deltaproteobacteria bacterium]|nr:hypothetical protein [Deltaproteobacteria bacterium]
MARIAAALLLLPLQALAEEPIRNLEGNSFFVEEAYNMDEGHVAQTVTMRRDRGGDWMLVSSQDWALGSSLHQGGFAFAYGRQQGPGSAAGAADTALNYRFQVADGDEGLALSPRLTVTWPTGSPALGLGTGGVGFAANLPASKRWGNWGATHLNLGGGHTPSGKGADGASLATTFLAAGGSVAWAPLGEVNLLLETLFTRSWAAGAATDSLVVSPGVRFGTDLGAVKLVGGLSAPLGVLPADRRFAVIGYFSIDLPARWPGVVASQGAAEERGEELAATGPRRVRQGVLVAQAEE